MWPSVVGQTQFLTGRTRVHASTGRRVGGGLTFERHLAGGRSIPPVPGANVRQAAGEPAFAAFADPDVLLLVALDDRRRTNLRVVRILAELTTCPPLPEQIPALIELDLNRLKPNLVVIRQRIVAVQTLLLMNEVRDLREHRFVRCLLLGHVSPKPLLHPEPVKDKAPVPKCYNVLHVAQTAGRGVRWRPGTASEPQRLPGPPGDRHRVSRHRSRARRGTSRSAARACDGRRTTGLGRQGHRADPRPRLPRAAQRPDEAVDIGCATRHQERPTFADRSLRSRLRSAGSPLSFLPAYFDTSAIVKLVVVEPESDALVRALVRWPDRVSSALARVEVHRALWRAGASRAAHARADAVLSALVLVRPDEPVLSQAASFRDPHLRALDAIHLATALTLGDDPDAFITYDARLALAANRLRLPVLHPGVDRLS